MAGRAKIIFTIEGPYGISENHYCKINIVKPYCYLSVQTTNELTFPFPEGFGATVSMICMSITVIYIKTISLYYF